MRAADTSVVIAAFAAWHESHDAARRALDSGLRLIEHCALETYSVLTRLPPPHRTSGEVVREFLTARFPEPWLRLRELAYKDFVLGLPNRSVAGGAAYDALVAATAAGCDAELVTCDRRALPVYERYGIRVQLLP
ncbi:MAG: PIN domain-containing protein [Betaproteobacteria bacterium]|nr:PIN domain-containing protein [Betaproteobacteria bacterium]